MNTYPTTTVSTTTTVPAPSVPAPSTPTRQERAAQMTATVDAACERLAEQLAAGHTEAYLQFLAFHAKFHRYSPANALLILSQRPEASRVAGLSTWNRLGYRVRAGEKAIWIWAPVLRKVEDNVTGEERETLVGFRPAPVFDASQLANLDEQPLPSPFTPLPDDVEELYRRVRASIEAERIAVEERPLPMGVQGVSLGGTIFVRRGLDSRNRLAVLLHELAHELAHRGEAQRAKPVALRELEAESTAYVVGSALGLEVPHSADYLLGYGLDAAALRAALGTVQHLARRVLEIVDDFAMAHVRR
ncbi:MAG: ArdC-like ssDNA-binding domain-containing protein, partial [Chloroflexota bacterium]|nr:ArdC-like ssDNA-binding domain-containing protein [Chloroflexota bacterium]